MRACRRTWEIRHTARYHQWNHTRARSADKQQITTNHITIPSRQVSSLISNSVFNIDAPANANIRLKTNISTNSTFTKFKDWILDFTLSTLYIIVWNILLYFIDLLAIPTDTSLLLLLFLCLYLLIKFDGST